MGEIEGKWAWAPHVPSDNHWALPLIAASFRKPVMQTLMWIFQFLYVGNETKFFKIHWVRDQGRWVGNHCRKEMSVTSLHSPAICSLGGEEFSPTLSSYINGKQQRKDNGRTSNEHLRVTFVLSNGFMSAHMAWQPWVHFQLKLRNGCLGDSVD